MKHYEIIIMIHPEKTEKVNKIILALKKNIFYKNGKIHRLEEWGLQNLAYPIKKIHKAYYILLNIEIQKKRILNIQKKIYNNEYIIRNLILKISHAIKNKSIFLSKKNKNI